MVWVGNLEMAERCWGLFGAYDMCMVPYETPLIRARAFVSIAKFG